MGTHKSYKETINRECDFRVRYRFYTLEEGGRWSPVFQGYRSDFWYYHEENQKDMHFMIWPEFENENGDIIMENDSPIDLNGTARMWIITKGI